MNKIKLLIFHLVYLIIL